MNWPSLVERKIRDAQDEGFFDDLPGRGKPLDLSAKPYVKPDHELAYRVLQAAGFTLDWIELDREIRTELDECQRFLEDQLAWLERTLGSREGALVAGSDLQEAHHRAVRRFRQRAERLNGRIDLFNLKVPLVVLQRHKVRITEELLRFGESWLRTVDGRNRSRGGDGLP